MQQAGLILAALALLCLSLPTQAEPAERDAVLAAVQLFFDAMREKDAAKAGEVLLPPASFVSVREAGGRSVVKTFTRQEMLDLIAKSQYALHERIWDPVVLIHGRLATVWAPYDFHVDGAFSHCGFDSFQLVKGPVGWGLAGSVYSVQLRDCAPSPLGPPSQ